MSALAHDLRASLNGIKTWAHVLEECLREPRDPVVARALQGIRTGIEQQVHLIENLLEAGGVEASLRGTSMSKRNDSRPDVPDDRRPSERPQRPEPEPDTLEGPGGRHESKAEEDARNKATRQGER